MFYERMSVSKFSLYFIELLDYGKRRVMACGACGALYATDELGDASQESTADKVIGTAEKAGAQISATAKSVFGKLGDAAKSSLEQLRVAASDEPSPALREEPHEDPLAAEDEELESKFKDLEKRYRIDTSK